MIDNNFIRNLEDVGLTRSEAKVYFYLLKKKNFTAAEISILAQVPQSKVYEILAKLVQKGLCIETLGKVKKYSPVNPKVGFNIMFKEIEKKKKKLTDLSEDLLPRYLSGKETIDPLDYIQVLREKSRLVEKVESLERMTKYEVLTFNKPPYAMNIINQDSVSKREEFNKLKIGIKYKSIYEADDARNLDFLKNIEKFISAGEDVKIANELPMKMMIFDDKIVMIALQDKITSKSSLTTMIVEHPDLAKTLKETFNLHWQKAMTLEEFKIKEKI